MPKRRTVQITGSLNLSAVAQSIVPSAANTYDLGSNSNYWANLYVNTISGGATGRIVMAMNVRFNALASFYNNVATAGLGVPAIYASGRATAQTAAVASICTFTPASDATCEVALNALVTSSTTFSFNCECAYTDEGNTARVLNLPFILLAGGSPTNTIQNANGAVPYHGIALKIRAKGGTSITLRTQAAGTYTSVTYNIEGTIKQLA